MTFGTHPVRSHAVTHIVEAQRYNSEVHCFDSRWDHWHFSL